MCVASEVWILLFSHEHLNLLQNYDDDVIRWIGSPTNNSKLNTICKLLLQAIVYSLYGRIDKFKGSHIILQSSNSSSKLKDIQLTLRGKLAGLDCSALSKPRPPSKVTAAESYLSTWFQRSSSFSSMVASLLFRLSTCNLSPSVLHL